MGEHWGSCNKTCDNFMKWDTQDHVWKKHSHHVWDCKKLSCVKHGEDCSLSKCCNEPGYTCFKKHDSFAMCNKTCSHNMIWSSTKGWEEAAHKVWDCDVLTP